MQCVREVLQEQVPLLLGRTDVMVQPEDVGEIFWSCRGRARGLYTCGECTLLWGRM